MTAITDGADESPPVPTQDRTAFARPDGPATLRLLHEPLAPTSRFTNVGDEGGRFRSSNNVTYLFGGDETFAAMAKALKTVTGTDHFIYVAGWFFSFDQVFLKPAPNPNQETFKSEFQLVAGDASTAHRRIFKAAVAAGAQVRALLWRNATMGGGNFVGQFSPHNADEVNEINGFPGDAAAILDSQGPNAFAHHQKLLIVNGKDGLVAFSGGVDINQDRAGGLGLYDMHCRVVGPSAADLLQTFVERWNDHPDRDSAEAKPGTRKLLAVDPASHPPAPAAGAHHSVQVARTYSGLQPNLSLRKFYNFAPSGKVEAFKQLVGAIKQSQRFIYMENQYFTSLDVAHALALQLPSLEHLTIFLQSWSDLLDAYRRTNACLKILRDADGGAGKVRVFCYTTDAGKQRYVHSKTWIFDDELAIVGSANANRRGYTHDSECSISVVDRSTNDRPTWRFAHRLRVRCWAFLLGMDTPEGHAELADGCASAVHWLNLPANALVQDYQRTADGFIQSQGGTTFFGSSGPGTTVTDTLWDSAVDPTPGVIGP